MIAPSYSRLTDRPTRGIESPHSPHRRRDGRIAYVDFGNVAQLTQTNKETLIDAVVHAVNEDYDSMAGDLLHLVCRLRDGRREVRRLGGVTLVLGSLHAASGDEIALEASLRCVLYTGPHTTALAW